METDFLNIRDGEQFFALDYKENNSLLELFKDDYHSQHCSEDISGDSGSYWEFRNEQELNGDTPVFESVFPSMDCKEDFQKMLRDWQEHIDSLEGSDTEDLNLDSCVTNEHNILNDYIYDLNNVKSEHADQDKFNTSSDNVLGGTLSDVDLNLSGENDILLNGLSNIKKEDSFEFKNFDLVNAVVKDEIDLGFLTEDPILEFVDNLEDKNVNILEDKNINNGAIEIEPNVKLNKQKKNKKSKNVKKKSSKSKSCQSKSEPIIRSPLKIDVEEDCIDVVTVSPNGYQPVIEAGDVTSLLEQFEASEAVNRTHKKDTEIPTYVDNASKNISQVNKSKRKYEVTQENNVNKSRTSINLDHNYCTISTNCVSVIKKDKALKNGKTNSKKNTFNKTCEQNIKIIDSMIKSINAISDESKTNKSSMIVKSTENLPNKIKNDCVQQKNVSVPSTCTITNSSTLKPLVQNSLLKPNSRPQLLMMVNQKSLLMKNNGQKSLLKSNNPGYKNADGKMMVSVLKNNKNIPTSTVTSAPVVCPQKNEITVNTRTSNDECIQNIITEECEQQQPKKRKLNLEEYKKRREINRPQSCNNSRTSSPINHHVYDTLSVNGSFSLPVTAIGSPISQPGTPVYESNETVKKAEDKKMTPHEKLLKMAADLLMTPAKSNGNNKVKVPVNVVPEIPEKPAQTPNTVKTKYDPPKPCSDEIEMLTIVSIGVNTDETLIKSTEDDAKIVQTLIKKSDLLKHGKHFENQISTPEQKKLTEIITPILKNASNKINRNSLISNITETILTNPNITAKVKSKSTIPHSTKTEPIPPEHGEDKTVIVLNKNRARPKQCSIEIQTDPIVEPKVIKTPTKRTESKSRSNRQYRSRRISISSSSSSSSVRTPRKSPSSFHSRHSSYRSPHRRSTSSMSSSRLSRSRSRSDSRSSYSSSSSRSSSRSRTCTPPPLLHNRNRLSGSSSSSSYNKFRRSPSNYRNRRRSRSPVSYTKIHKGRTWQNMDKEKLKQIEERRVIYVGRLELNTTKADLYRKFEKFGSIIDVSVHFREQGDNFGFVTFSYQEDAYEAMERRNDDPDLEMYDISFGGRRAFCKTRYSDLDNSETIEMSNYAKSVEEESFDNLLKEAQAKLRKRKL